jgi:hypothetical protein
MAPRRVTTIVLASIALISATSACGGDKKAAGSSKVAIDATDTTCDVADTALDPGSTTFLVSNNGTKTTEVYVFGADGAKFTKIVGEVENIGPGTSRDFKVSLPAGTFEVACKPGQKGDGIRTRITAGNGSAAAESSASAAYDREIDLSTDGKAVTGLTGGAKVGEKIEFKLTNTASGPRVLELKDAAGAVAGETQPIAPGGTGELVVTLDSAGSWSVIVEGEGADTITVALTVV